MFKKGIIFTGCSYTWGSGLYYYAPFNDIQNIEKGNLFNSHNITQAMYKFMCANRFSRLVANQLGSWEVNKPDNGGSDDASITWLRYILNLDNNTNADIKLKHFKNYGNEKYSIDEIEYVIFQLTDPFRNHKVYLGDEHVELNIAGIRLRDGSAKNEIGLFKGRVSDDMFDKFFKFYSENFNSWEEMEEYFIKQNLDLIKKLFIELEAKGIKCRIWTWQNEYVPYLKQDEFFNKIYIRLKHKGQTFDSLANLMKFDPQMMISTSDFRFNGETLKDDHQSLECNKVIADNIVEYILTEQH